MNRLRSVSNLFVLTAPSTRNPLSYTEKRIWIEEHFDYEFTKRLILSPDKGLLKGNFLIDDHIDGKGKRFAKDQFRVSRSPIPEIDPSRSHPRLTATVNSNASL